MRCIAAHLARHAGPAILLRMQTDPMEEWRRLTALYGEMGDVEIRELADQINDLTPHAQQVLRDEIKKRGLTDNPASSTPNREINDDFTHWQEDEDTAADVDKNIADSGSGDYTWKTALRRCESMDEAAARCEMLRRAGIESWIQRPGSRFVVPWLESGRGEIQINVAADQLDRAQSIIGRPIPQEILNQVKEEAAAPLYELPSCPKCRTEDPTLESVEPSNNWLCESCGYTWSDPVPDEEGD
jgi:rubrerythrin